MNTGIAESGTRTVYNVHVYREMRLFYPDVVATSHEDAALLAAAKRSDDADLIDDCDGESFAALVDVDGDPDYCQSRTIDFPAAQLRNCALELLKALELLIQKSDDLHAAIEGVTDQFETEVAGLSEATSAAERIARKARGQS